MSDKVTDSLRVLDDAITEHNPSHVFALFSGGHDSLSASAITSRHPRFAAAVHISTGIGIPQTREFVRDVCRDQHWPLIELHPPVPYREIVLEHGFPGPAGHQIMYARLKERALRLLIRRFKQNDRDRIMLVTGARQNESVRRVGNAINRVERDGATVWVNAIQDWSKITVNAFLEVEKLPRNPVVDLIHMSGECKCGAFAHPGEREEDRRWFPEFAAELDALEAEVEAAGNHACIWGARPPEVHPDQEALFSRRLCQSCEARFA